MATITAAADIAEGIDAILRPQGIRVARTGDVVTIPDYGLSLLADLPQDADGHFDGSYIWVACTEYDVEV